MTAHQTQRFFLEFARAILSRDRTALASKIHWPIVIYRSDTVTIMNSSADLSDFLETYCEIATPHENVRVEVHVDESLQQADDLESHVVTITFRRIDGIELAMVKAKYFVRAHADGMRIEMVECLDKSVVASLPMPGRAVWVQRNEPELC